MAKSSANESKPVVLLVEDNADAASAVSEALRAMGFDVHVCNDGPMALEKARELSPFAAVVDIGLPPGMDGYEVGQRLRIALGPKLRLFALTGYSGDDDKKRASGASFDAYMVKPVDIEQLAIWLNADGAIWEASGHAPLDP
jgi:CheY-like chemotaxis protein